MCHKNYIVFQTDMEMAFMRGSRYFSQGGVGWGGVGGGVSPKTDLSYYIIL